MTALEAAELGAKIGESLREAIQCAANLWTTAERFVGSGLIVLHDYPQVVHQAIHGRTERVRKKNKARLKRLMLKEVRKS